MNEKLRVLLVEDEKSAGFDIVRVLYEKLGKLLVEEKDIEVMIASYTEMKERFVSADVVLIGYPNRALIPRMAYIYGKTTYVDLIDLRAYSILDAEAIKTQIMTIKELSSQDFHVHHQNKWSILCSFKNKKRV
ncbi:hypothetical protein [Candidatus Enterococcus clewellii]|uniref:PTS EIIB type-3 domain-containing protein n=1 Tax=Candidatus Enterococcus clewellii TaxID=1834193 RepID=A0A242K5L9_9ENTE|nr:hypothetical protein [Enterococcus sp. 9E7_DIV0242]OTP14444.1 hypothetical protein A5888_002545 [Enterococcus sp. 9E7_DIV0242]